MMEDVDLSLLLNYPLISKTVDKSSTVYRGSINIKNEDYEISITEKNKKFKVTLPKNLKIYKGEFNKSLSTLPLKNILSILDKIKTFFETKDITEPLKNNCEIYSHVLREYSEFTNFYFNLKSCFLETDLSKINITYTDDQNRPHSVEISVQYDKKNINNVFKITNYDLPKDKVAFTESSSLRTIYDQFIGYVQSFQDFFNLMETFDKFSWVLDPENPRKGDCYRRIRLENFSFIITVDPANLCSVPDFKFLGPERWVENYRSKINENLENWSVGTNINVYEDILKLLGLTSFPTKMATNDNNYDVLIGEGDCCICFAARMDNKLPEIICKNKCCECYYHTACLYEWMVSINARRFFNEIVGNCPNCEKTISCPILK